jgi:hypothetical protein
MFAHAAGPKSIGSATASPEHAEAAPSASWLDRVEKEQAIQRVATAADSYYRSIWDCSSKAERIVLCHVAADRFANGLDVTTVQRLMDRGLVYRAPRLSLMNDSFRRFVLANAADVIEEAERSRPRSVWDGVSWPLRLTVIVAVVFIFATQQEAFSAANALLASLLTAAPSVSRLFAWAFQGR